METSYAFSMTGRPEDPAGQIRMTRLNIYSGLYIEFPRTRVLVDPSYILPEVALELYPDLILVSHESMDHFDAAMCLKLLSGGETELIGSWGVITALCSQLAPADPRWRRIHVGIPGAVFEFGDLLVKVEAAQHCEYAVPIFFDLRDARSGFRILDTIDTEITPTMESGEIEAGADILIVPLGIAKAASPSTAWRIAELLRPRVVFASHFTTQAEEFRALAPAGWSASRAVGATRGGSVSNRDLLEPDAGGTRSAARDEKLIVADWFGGVTLAGPDPAFRLGPVVWMTAPAAYPGLTPLLPAGIYNLPWQEDIILEQLNTASANPRSLSTALYFLTCSALRGGATLRAVDALEKVRVPALSSGDEPLIAAYLLALGATAGAVVGSERKVDLSSLKRLMSPELSYIDYWVLEAWGRAAMYPPFRQWVARSLEEVAACPDLSAVVGVRRKLSWEVFRLVEAGYLWPGLPGLLEKGRLDSNPDVRLLTYKTLAQCYKSVPSGPAMLSAGLVDEHEDVLEWSLRAHIRLFDVLEPENRDALAARLPALLTYPNYHVRQRANALAELCGGA